MKLDNKNHKYSSSS